MLKPETKKLLEDMWKSPYGRALEDFLNEEKAKLDTVRGTSTRTKEQDIGRELALEIVDRLFSFLPKEAPKLDKPKGQYR